MDVHSSVGCYLFIPLLLFTRSTLQSVSSLSSAIHCVFFTEHSFPSSSLLSTHPFMRCDGAMAPTVIHRSCLLGITKEDLLTKITALAKEKLTIDKNPTCHESSAVQLLRWGILNSLDPHNSRDLLLLF